MKIHRALNTSLNNECGKQKWINETRPNFTYITSLLETCPALNAILDDTLACTLANMHYSTTHIPPHVYSSTRLRPGIRYTGTQTGHDIHDPSKELEYKVVVQFSVTDVDKSEVSGCLSIYDLTPNYHILTTYFEVEIVGRGEYGFITNKWGADAAIDSQHWSRFEHWNTCGLSQTFANNPNTKYEYRKDNILYMRWKEQFLMPEFKKTDLVGASYDGFYYVCLDIKTGHIEGYYYHESSANQVQKLSLNEIEDLPTQDFSFR